MALSFSEKRAQTRVLRAIAYWLQPQSRAFDSSPSGDLTVEDLEKLCGLFRSVQFDADLFYDILKSAFDMSEGFLVEYAATMGHELTEFQLSADYALVSKLPNGDPGKELNLTLSVLKSIVNGNESISTRAEITERLEKLVETKANIERIFIPIDDRIMSGDGVSEEEIQEFIDEMDKNESYQEKLSVDEESEVKEEKKEKVEENEYENGKKNELIEKDGSEIPKASDMASAVFSSTFFRDLLGMIGRPLLQPTDEKETCRSCYEEFDADERKPLYTKCCDAGTICSSCVSKWRVSEPQLKKEDSIFFMESTCPYCRRPFKTAENEELLEGLKQQFQYEKLIGIDEPEGIKCVLCETVGHKPHHLLVCLTCRGDVCEWLLSGREEDRSKIKAGTYCFICSYKHSLYHDKRRHERNELRPLSHLIGYTRAQVEAASDAMQKRIKDEGYLPRSLSILYSLWRDVSEGKRIELMPMTRLTEILRVTERSVVAMQQGSELREVAIADFSVFLMSLADDLKQWSEKTLSDCWNLMKDGEWAHSVAQLLIASFEWVVAIVPDVMDNCWVYLRELIMHLLPSIVKRLAENDDWREQTMQICQLIDGLKNGDLQ